MAADEYDMNPAAMMQSALIAAGMAAHWVRIVMSPDEEMDSDVRVSGSGGIIVTIQCGRDKEGLYFIADHWYAVCKNYPITPAHIPDDPAKVAVVVMRYLSAPKYDTQWPPWDVYPTEAIDRQTGDNG